MGGVCVCVCGGGGVTSIYFTRREFSPDFTYLMRATIPHIWGVPPFLGPQKSKAVNGSVCLVPSYLGNKQISDHSSDYNKTSSCFRETFKFLGSRQFIIRYKQALQTLPL